MKHLSELLTGICFVTSPDLRKACEQDGPPDMPSVSLNAIKAQVSSTIEKLLGSAISDSQPFTEGGLDSLGAVELRTQLTTDFSVDLPATLAYDYPTVEALSQYIAAQVSEGISTAGKAIASSLSRGHHD